MRESPARIPIASAAETVKELRPLRGRSLSSRSLTVSSLRLGVGYRQADACPFFKGSIPPYLGRVSVEKWGTPDIS